MGNINIRVRNIKITVNVIIISHNAVFSNFKSVGLCLQKLEDFRGIRIKLNFMGGGTY